MTVYVPLLQQQLLRKHHLYNLLVFDSSLVQNEKFIMTFSQRISREYISKKSNLSKFKLIHIPVFLYNNFIRICLKHVDVDAVWISALVIEDFHDDQQQQTKPDVRSAGEKIRLGTNKTLKSKIDFQAIHS